VCVSSTLLSIRTPAALWISSHFDSIQSTSFQSVSRLEHEEEENEVSVLYVLMANSLTTPLPPAAQVASQQQPFFPQA